MREPLIGGAAGATGGCFTVTAAFVGTVFICEAKVDGAGNNGFRSTVVGASIFICEADVDGVGSIGARFTGILVSVAHVSVCGAEVDRVGSIRVRSVATFIASSFMRSSYRFIFIVSSSLSTLSIFIIFLSLAKIFSFLGTADVLSSICISCRHIFISSEISIVFCPFSSGRK